MGRRRVLLYTLLFGFLGCILAGRPPAISKNSQDDPTPYRKRSSSAIGITPDGGTLLAVNPDSHSITLIDTFTKSVITEIGVGVDPRTISVDGAGERAYVANQGSGTISIIDLDQKKVLAEMPAGQRPYGVLVSPDGNRLYVAEGGGDRLGIYDTQELKLINAYPTAPRPSGLALSENGRQLIVSHLLDKTVTFVDTYRPYVIRLPMVARSATGQVEAEAAHKSLKSPVVNLNPAAPVTTIHLWSDSNLVQSIVIAPDDETAYIPHTRSNTTNRALTFDSTVFPLVSLIDLPTKQHLVGQQIDLATLDPPGVGLPFDAAVTPDGQEMWVVNAASNDITVVNLSNRKLSGHIEVGHNPRGIVLSPDGSAAYVNNVLGGTVSVIDTAAYSLTNTITTTQIPLPPLLLAGKRLFNSSDDARMSNAQWIACSTCHFDGEQDGRTWFFGFAGPRNTTSLLGMIQTYPLRWSAEWDESADGEFAIRKENFGSGLILGEMHCSLSPVDCVNQPPNQGRDGELDALAAFMDSLAIPLSPFHMNGEPLSAAELRGRDLFNDPAVGCANCHPAPLYTDKLKHDVGTSTPDERIGPAYDTPSLRGLHSSAPYFHDGSAATLLDTVTRASPGSEHDVSGQLTDQEIDDLIGYLLALPFE